MGIQHLNKYIRNKITLYNSNNNNNNKEEGSAIKTITFSELNGKKIVIDTSIYMYRFSSERCLIDSMYQMISLFKMNGIIPIFVFDGPSPVEKKELIKQRREEKQISETKYKELHYKLKDVNDYEERKEINNELDSLKKKFVRLKREDINNVKNLLTLYGVTYYEADGEADKLCAKLVTEKHAYACLSEDMDLFVYGCDKVLRYISLLNSTFVLYDLNKILECLDLSFTHFKEICVISGTDYTCHYNDSLSCNSINPNNSINPINFYKTLQYYEKYKLYINDQNENENENENENGFYDWVNEHTNYINNYEELQKIYNMFSLDDITVDKFINNHSISSDAFCKNKLNEFLEKYDFVFV